MTLLQSLKLRMIWVTSYLLTLLLTLMSFLALSLWKAWSLLRLMLQLKIGLTRCNLLFQSKLRKERRPLKVKFKIRLTKSSWYRDSCLNKLIKREDSKARLLKKFKRLSSHKMYTRDSRILTKSVKCLKHLTKNFRMLETSTSSTWFVYQILWKSRMSKFNSNLYQRQL